MDSYSDNDLLKKLALGDKQAFEILVKRYQNLVFTVCKNIVKDNFVAEDLAQDVFVKIYNNVNQFRFEAAFKTWLYKICYNTCFQYLKSQTKTFQQYAEELPVNKTEESGGIFEQLTLNEKNNYIKEAIQELEPFSAALIQLYYYESYSINEICQITNQSVSNIKIQLFRARKVLSLLLSKKMCDYV